MNNDREITLSDLSPWLFIKAAFIGTSMIVFVVMFLAMFLHLLEENGTKIYGNDNNTGTITITNNIYEHGDGDPEDLRCKVSKAANKYGIAPPYLMAVATIETNWHPEAIGPPTRFGRAVGLTQILPMTAKDICGLTGTDKEITQQLLDVDVNIDCGAQIFKRYFEMQNGSVALTYAAYNAGPAKAKIAIKSYGETIRYVQKAAHAIQSFDPNQEPCEEVSCLRIKAGAKDGGPNSPILDEIAIAIQADPDLKMMTLRFSAFNDGDKAHNPNGWHPKGLAMDIVPNYPNDAEEFIAGIEGIIKTMYPNLKFKLLNEIPTKNHVHLEIYPENQGDSL